MRWQNLQLGRGMASAYDVRRGQGTDRLRSEPDSLVYSRAVGGAGLPTAVMSEFTASIYQAGMSGPTQASCFPV